MAIPRSPSNSEMRRPAVLGAAPGEAPGECVPRAGGDWPIYFAVAFESGLAGTTNQL
jgi:hypothetical protein